MEEVKRLINSRRGYRSHLKRLFATAGEILEWGNTDNTATLETTLADLIEQLERKRSILVELDKQISAGIGDDDLESEILESEEIQAEFSSTMAWVKRLMQKLQVPTRSSHHHLHKRSMDHHYLRTPNQGLHWLCLSRQAVRKTLTMTQVNSTLHRDHQMHSRNHRTSDASNTSHTKPCDLEHGVNSTVRLPGLDLPTFSGDALEWRPFWDGFDVHLTYQCYFS